MGLLLIPMSLSLSSSVVTTKMSRRQRLRKDRLTSLPDEILEHILSYLPTKDSVATSFLSKRWKSRSLWRSQLNLDFDDKTFQDSFSFRLFLHYFVTNGDNTQPIHSFQLNCSSHGNVIPTSILSIKTLSVLKLKSVTLNEDDPCCFDFPSLKVLHLESVTFTCYNNISILLSACPILEELETKDLNVEELESPAGADVLSLSNLVSADISGDIIRPHWLHNVHHLRIKMWFDCLDGMFHNLIHMELIFDCTYHSQRFKWGWLIKLLQNSPKLQTMIIEEYDDTIHNYADQEWKDPEFVPECFLSHLTTCSLRNYTSPNCRMQFAKYIMQNSRVLSTMTIQIAKSVKSSTKIQMCKELSLCPTNSATCKLLFI
ncbi:putative FBD-associated F-box protein At3g50710 isoform X2 [Trifolium pratense]|uniref:putative FBD-associated F-box protein At3g50710 isoform X2 n=1 Tax=Trifolium pratense TaxID=57577 RepID=UPI001E69275B|nr:putative FBD-associated F-box protein At3g50710 isoform X2 [Trifolium pratense]